MRAICLNTNCPSESFVTIAHVSEDWIVDADGNYIDTLRSVETVSGPNPSNKWVCTVCGTLAKVYPYHLAFFMYKDHEYRVHGRSIGNTYEVIEIVNTTTGELYDGNIEYIEDIENFAVENLSIVIDGPVSNGCSRGN